MRKGAPSPKKVAPFALLPLTVVGSFLAYLMLVAAVSLLAVALVVRMVIWFLMEQVTQT